jgi:anti-anti-sigma factor
MDDFMTERSEVTIQEKMGCTWVVLPDAITMNTYASVEAEIDRVISGKSARVVLDLSQTNNLFSSGLGLLIHVSKRACELSGSICLVNVSRKIRGIVEAVHLDVKFPLYATDVEFEISQEQFKQRVHSGKFGFFFIARIEEGMYRINCSGDMTTDQDLSAASHFMWDEAVNRYLFDLTGLDMIDSSGAAVFIKLIKDIREHGAISVAYGASQDVAELMDLLGMDEFILILSDERAALTYCRK